MGAALVLPALYGLKHHSPYNPDDYEAIAAGYARTGMLTDDGVRPTAVREPVYPVVLGTFYGVFGHRYAATLLCNGLLMAAAVYALWWVGAALFGEAVGLVAAAVAAFYPPFIFYASEPRRESALVLLSVWSVAALLAAVKKGGRKRFAAAGVVGAAAALGNTTLLPFGLGAVPALLFWLGRKNWKRAAPYVGVYALFFVLFYSLWPSRNARAFHKLVVGSSVGAGGIFYVNMVVPPELGGLPAEAEILLHDPVCRDSAYVPEDQHDAYYMKAGLKRIREKPSRWLKIVLKRFFVEAWRVTPRPRNYEQSFRLLWWVSVLSDGWIVPLSLIGLLLWRLKPPEAAFIPAMVFVVNGIYSVIFFILRYRIPMMPWLILFASLTIHCAYGELLRARSS